VSATRAAAVAMWGIQQSTHNACYWTLLNSEFSRFRRARAELAIRATQEKLAAQRRKIVEMQQHYAAAQKAAAGAGAGGR